MKMKINCPASPHTLRFLFRVPDCFRAVGHPERISAENQKLFPGYLHLSRRLHLSLTFLPCIPGPNRAPFGMPTAESHGDNGYNHNVANAKNTLSKDRRQQRLALKRK